MGIATSAVMSRAVEHNERSLRLTVLHAPRDLRVLAKRVPGVDHALDDRG
jgi:hypothetical protein